MEEAFCTGIIPVEWFATHYLCKLLFLNKFSLLILTVLAASVTMKDHFFGNTRRNRTIVSVSQAS